MTQIYKYLIFRIFTVFILLSAPISVMAGGPFREIKNFGSNPGNLYMFVHEPKNEWESGKKYPLVIVLHGCMQDAKSVAEQSGWNKIADQQDFLILYPQQSPFNNTGACFNWYKAKHVLKDQGEMMSIKQMLDYMLQYYGVDSQKVFIYGLSAGAAMGAAFMANYPQLINTGAILAGAPFSGGYGMIEGSAAMLKPNHRTGAEWAKFVNDQNPNYIGSYPRLIAVHGKKDLVVNPENSGELIKQWTYLLKTDGFGFKKEDAFLGFPDLHRSVYYDSLKREAVIYYEIENIGHALAVNPGPAENQGGLESMFSIVKGYHSTWIIAKDFGLVK